MYEEEFYAAIKMVSGEEVFSKVCPCEEQDRTILILDNPVLMETITIRQLGMTALKVIPWMKLTDDTMFIVEMNRIITMTEVNDSSIIKVYQKYIRERNKISSKSQLSSNMGFISSIADARVSLEKLYKSNSKT
jgi:hypothetical protein